MNVVLNSTLAGNFLNFPTISYQLTFTSKYVPTVPQLAYGGNVQAPELPYIRTGNDIYKQDQGQIGSAFDIFAYYY